MKKSRAILILSIIGVIVLIPTVISLIWSYKYTHNEELLQELLTNLRNFATDHYWITALLLFFVCMIQVIVALVPGEVVEIAAGFVFGPIVGTLLCLASMTVGSIIVLLLSRRFGRKFVYVFYPKEKLDALTLFKDASKRNITTFYLFLIPGTPKDLLTYCIGLTDMKIWVYILLTTVARIPSIITSSFIGDALGKQDFWMTLIVTGVTALISGLGILLYRWIKKRHHSADEPSAADNTPTA